MSAPERGKAVTVRTKDLSGQEDVQSKGSDIEYDFTCDACEEDSRLEAYGFCSDCNHYLCKTCFTAHRRPIPMRNHKLLDKNEMPKIRPQPTFEKNEVIEEKCKEHVGRVVEFYCGNHDTIGCSVCIRLEHNSCDNIQFVPDINVDNDKVSTIIKELNILRSNAKTAQVQAKERVVQTNDSFDNVLQEGKQFCKKTKDFIERLETIFEETTQIKREFLIGKSESTIASLEKTVQYVESLSETLIGYRSLKKEANLVIAVKNAEEYIECSPIEDSLDACEDSNTGYVFVPDKELNALQENVESLGIAMPISKQLSAEPLDETLALFLHREFSARAKDDTSDCIIVGIVSICGPDRDIVADAGNKKIKVIKDASTISASLKLSTKPYAMAKFSDNKVCVTIPEKKKILVINISKLFMKDTIKIVKSIDCGGKCYGIASEDETIIVTCEYESDRFAIHFMNLNGNMLNQLTCTDNEPTFLAVYNDCLYTLDTKRALLKSLSRVDGSTERELKVEKVTHFTVADNFLVFIVDSPKVLRVFDHDFHEKDVDRSGDDSEMNPVSLNGECDSCIFTGHKDGRVQRSLLFNRQVYNLLVGHESQERNALKSLMDKSRDSCILIGNDRYK